MREETNTTEKKLSVEKGKQGILKVIFGRTTILIALLLFQLLVLFWLFSVLAQYIDTVYIYVLYQVFVAVLVLYIVNQEENPAFKLAWILPVLIFPVFGALFYVFVKLQPNSALLNRRLRRLEEKTRGFCTAGRTSDGKTQSGASRSCRHRFLSSEPGVLPCI